jgi:hypothetical protein
MLASKFTNNVTNTLAGRDTAGTGGPVTTAAQQFAFEYAPVANLTTLDVKTSIGVQADIVAMFNLTASGFSWDLGYNFWGRSCEKIHCPPACAPCDVSLCDPSQANTWGLKGDARMFGFAANASGGVVVDTPIALSSTESKATIHSGTNIPGGLDTVSNDPYERNFSVDNAKFAVAVNGNVRLVFAPFIPGPNQDAFQVKTSIQPILLKCEDIDLCERTRGISHKIFTHLGYTWDRENLKPFLGFGGFAEFGKTDHNSSSCNPCSESSECSRCFYCSLSQWGVWVKGGLAFD